MPSSDDHKETKQLLWAPWRMTYIETCGVSDGCIFCEKPKQKTDRENLIVYRAEHVFVIMNRFPYNNGHMMVVPYRHIADLSLLDLNEKTALMDLITVCQQVLQQVMAPHGYNVGMNLGRTAGAGIADHLHFHIVPRWNGDTNFMPVLGETKVISEALERTWDKLNTAFQSMMSK